MMISKKQRVFRQCCQTCIVSLGLPAWQRQVRILVQCGIFFSCSVVMTWIANNSNGDRHACAIGWTSWAKKKIFSDVSTLAFLFSSLETQAYNVAKSERGG